MDLGDGLLFVLEKGKPKLILLNSGEKVQKNPVKPRPKLPIVLSCRQPSRLETHTPRTEAQPIGKQAALNGRSHQSKAGRGWGQTVTASRTQENHAPGKEVKTKARVKSAKPQNVQRPNRKLEEPKKKAEQNAEPSNQSTTLPDSGVCLTNEQLQQMFHVVQTNDYPPNAEGIPAACVPEFVSSERMESEETSEETGTESALNKDRRSGGLPRWLEERPSKDRAALEAKKAQYKKELDEQVALKQKIHCSVPHRLQEDDTESLASVQSSVSYKDLPAAIRSSFRVGDFTPMEELVQEQGQEQRRRWLQELDKQRKEISERKRLEKLRRRQTEDHHLWTSHFDSFQRPPLALLPCSLPPLPLPLAPPLCPSADRGETGLSSRVSPWDEASVRASVETSSSSSGGHSTRASHLRTMTSLLDPAEIEERERRRLKQLEQQRAIELQMEERRRRREEEESLRKREEEEEERRIELERRRMQRQYEIDSQRERYKEQRPEPESEPESEPQSNTAANQGERPELEAVNHQPTVNHHKDTGVQTEVHISESFGPDSCGPVSGPSVVDRAQVLHMLQMLHKGFGSVVYGPFARTEGSRTDHPRKDEKRPEWNTQRPSRRFIPASQRYPEELQRQRQESRLRRQAQLLSLQRNLNLNNNTTTTSSNNNNNTSSSNNNNTSTGQNLRPDLSPTEQSGRVETFGQPSDGGRSPVHGESPAPDFLPYVRTDEVFSLKPAEAQTQHAGNFV